MDGNIETITGVEIPGVRIAYETAGRGPALMFLHGGLLDRHMWDDQFAFFARRYRVIRYDMRSSGDSETVPTTDPFTHHEDLRRFLKALHIDRLSLVGLSHYSIALDFTIAYPELVEKLVLVSPGNAGVRFPRSVDWNRVCDQDEGSWPARSERRS